jgi:hypothetical protein
MCNACGGRGAARCDPASADRNGGTRGNADGRGQVCYIPRSCGDGAVRHVCTIVIRRQQGVILVERPQMEGSSMHGAGVQPSQILVRMGTNRPRLELADLQNLRDPPFSSTTLQRRRIGVATMGSWEAWHTS